MAFNPSSTIYLCNVPIDNTYQNQIYFSSTTEQQTYFSNRVQKTFSNYLTVRKTLPDGSLVSSVKVDCNIDDLYNCNYMYYQNANHGTRFFYAFITKLIYINEGTTEIRFETDVYQTWRFDVTLKESYVVREHSKTDNIGDNVVPEKFNFQDYRYTKYPDGTTSIGDWGYLVTSTEPYNDDATDTLSGQQAGKRMTGIYQGLYFYYFTGKTTALSEFLKNADKDCIISISVIPHFNVSNNPVGLGETAGEGWISYADGVPEKTYNFNLEDDYYFETYKPKNNKLFTYPYRKFMVTNNSGNEVEYAIEHFIDPANVVFKMYGDISVNPSLTLIPQDHNNVSENYTTGISIKVFPQCSFNTDTFKLWLTKNQFSVGLGAVTGVGEIIGGVAMMATGAGAGVGGAMIAHGATGVLNTINSVYQASTEPNKGHTGNTQNNLLTAIGRNKFDFYMLKIRPEHAKTVDDFFTMYGYQTNKLKVPNVSSRPYFNYVQTVDCNITGAIPDDDMRQLKAMYNNGVTLWKSTATVGDYSVDNSPN